MLLLHLHREPLIITLITLELRLLSITILTVIICISQSEEQMVDMTKNIFWLRRGVLHTFDNVLQRNIFRERKTERDREIDRERMWH